MGDNERALVAIVAALANDFGTSEHDWKEASAMMPNDPQDRDDEPQSLYTAILET